MPVSKIDQFKNDAVARAESPSVFPGPHNFKAPDWGKALAKLDGMFEKIEPLIELATPSEYDFLVKLAAKALHQANIHVNPS